MDTLPIDILFKIYLNLTPDLLKLLFTYHYPSYFIGCQKHFWVHYFTLYEDVHYDNPFLWLNEYFICQSLLRTSHFCNHPSETYINIIESLTGNNITYCSGPLPTSIAHHLLIKNQSIIIYSKKDGINLLYCYMNVNQEQSKKILYTLAKLKLIPLQSSDVFRAMLAY